MNFVLNELSLRGQFSEKQSFLESLTTIMRIKQMLDHFGHTFKLHRKFQNKCAIGTTTIREAIRSLPEAKKRSIMSWITTVGPFWSDNQQHCSNDHIFINNQNIIESALAEAGYHCFLGEKIPAVSFAPSEWTYTPIPVNIEGANVSIDNFWSTDTLIPYLKDALPEPNSWKMLEVNSRKCFPALTILIDAFSYLNSEPFSRHIAKETFHLLNVLNFLKSNFDENGRPTKQWNEMFKLYFTGTKSRFSDSSESEKQDFDNELHFHNPEPKMPKLYCPWHGKIHSPQIRIHFTYPIENDKPLYIVYIGPKITKR